MSDNQEQDKIIPYDELLRMFLNVADSAQKSSDKVMEQETRIQNLLMQLHLAREELKRYKNG
jgi:hypothetical protein